MWVQRTIFIKIHPMKFLPTVLLTLILFLFSCREASTPLQPDSALTEFADSLIQSAVDSGQIAGAAIRIVQNGSSIFDKAYGFANLEFSIPMKTEYSFEIGSVTKQFTSAAILKLVEQGKIKLEDDFTDYIDFDTNGRKISIAQLMNHTSGISSYTEIPAFWNLSVHGEPRDSLVRLVENEDFLFEPGEALIYNNSAYFILGLLIEKVTGSDYEAFLKEEFFDALDMNSTYYCSHREVVKGRSYGYNYSPDGLQQKPYLDHTWPYAAGSLCSTTQDLYKWISALHGGKVLTDDLYQKMITPGSLKNGEEVRYAFGLANYENFGHRSIAHGGGINGFLSDTRYFPEEDLMIICLVNTTGPKGAGLLADELTWQILDKRESAPLELDIEIASVTGTYEGQVRGRRATVEISEFEDNLVLQVRGEAQADTLSRYVGNQTWMLENDQYIFRNNALEVEEIYGHYFLNRQSQ